MHESMVGEESMQHFLKEHEKLFRAFKTSYENEKRLVKRCKGFNEQSGSNIKREKAAIGVTHEDENTISILRAEKERAWKIVETAKKKEDKARKIIADLKNEIVRLSRISDP